MDIQVAMLAISFLLMLGSCPIEATSDLYKVILKRVIDRISQTMMDKVTMISYVNIFDNHGQPPSKMVSDVLNQLEVPKLIFNKEDVTVKVRDRFTWQESGGIAIWSVANNPKINETDLKNQLWTLDQNISGFKKCTTIVIDEFGMLEKMFDRDEVRYRAPEKMHCPAIIIRPSGKMDMPDNLITAFMCPYQDFSSKPEMVKFANGFNFERLETCPPPLKGIKATVVTIGYPPYVLLTKPENNMLPDFARDPETGSLIGVDNDVTSFICEGLQCGSFYLRTSLDNDFEYRQEDENGEDIWTGGVGEVMDGTATFRVGFYSVPIQTFQLTSYTGYAYQSEQGFSIGYPLPVVSLFNIIKPFDASSWITITFTIATFSLVFQIIQWSHERMGYHQMQRIGWWEIPVQTMEAMFEYRMVNFFAPNIQSARLLRFFFILFGAFFTWSYNSNIRANLLAKHIPDPVDSFEEIAERGIKFWTPKKSSMANYFTENKDNPPFDKLYSNMIAYDYSTSLDEDQYLHSKTLFDESYAVADTKLLRLYTNYPFDTHGFAARHFGQTIFSDAYSNIHMKKGAPFADQITGITARMIAMGFDEYFIWKRLPIEAKDWDPYADLAASEVLNLERVALAFMIWIFLITLATTTFLVEKWKPNTNFLSPIPNIRYEMRPQAEDQDNKVRIKVAKV